MSDYEDDNDMVDDKANAAPSHLFKPGQSGNLKGRPKGSSRNISEEDRAYFGEDSRKFLERALLRAKTWDEGIKIARELRALQHASLQAVSTRTDTTHTITLRWSTPEELASNERSLIDLSVDPVDVVHSLSNVDKDLEHDQEEKDIDKGTYHTD